MLTKSFNKRKIASISIMVLDLILSFSILFLDYLYKNEKKIWITLIEMGGIIILLIILLIELLLKKRRAIKVVSIIYITLGLIYSCYKITMIVYYFNLSIYEEYSINIVIAVVAGVNILIRLLCFLSLQFYISELKKREVFELRKKQEAFIDHLGNNTQESSLM